MSAADCKSVYTFAEVKQQLQAFRLLSMQSMQVRKRTCRSYSSN
jgi:hypothetical protein